MKAETENNVSLPLPLRRDNLFFYDMAGADDGSQWAVPWSDLMMTMFILFAMLFVFASSKHDVFEEILFGVEHKDSGQKYDTSESVVSLHQIRMQIEGRDESTMLADFQPEAGQLVLASPSEPLEIQKKETAVFFRPARATLENTAQQLLLDLGDRLRASNLRIHLVGYGDDDFAPASGFASNLDLALARATEVARFLTEKCGVARERILVSGQNVSVPLVPGSSRASQIRNRRVELFVSSGS